tara:strand:+ start:81 stop:401 length:321 start_codon:yes stop_codon:yes gene_type:complete
VVGKGSKRRPEKKVGLYSDNWDKIFNKEKTMIEIYGKTRCTFCTQAKMLCEQKGLEYTYKLLDADFTQEEFFEKFPNAKTFPQIIIEDVCIGGYQNLVEEINELGL